jgi:hypothetical protein
MILKSVVALAALESAVKRLGLSIDIKALPLAVAIELGYFIIFLEAKDNFAFTDASIVDLLKNANETINLDELTDLYFSKFETEIIAATDTFVKAVTYNRTFNDFFTLDDVSQIDKDFYGNKGNIFSFVELIGLTHNKVLPDSCTVGDVVANVISFKRSFTDPISLNDVEALDIGKLSTDSFVFADSQAKSNLKSTTDIFNVGDASYIDSEPTKTDSFSFSDTSLAAITKHITDAFALDDATLVDKDYYGYKGNIFSLSEVFSFVTSYKRNFSDTYGLGDVNSLALHKYFNDSFTVFDDPILNGALGSNVINTNLLNGTAIPYSGPSDTLIGINSNPSENFTFSDVSVKIGSKSIDDTFTFGSDLLGLEISKTVTDGFALNDAALVNKDFYGTTGNIVNINDLVTITHRSGRLLNGAAFNRTQIN